MLLLIVHLHVGVFCSMIAYIQQNEPDDPLVNPTEHNPFKDKKQCIML